MSYDLYVTYQCTGKADVNGIVENTDLNIPTRIALLAAALPVVSVKEHARIGERQGGGYKGLVFKDNPARTPYAQKFIDAEKQRLKRLGLWRPAEPDMTALPPYSTFLQFNFTLASPYLSRDDEIFHINDNPVRKDKVFKVPMIAGTAWKGNLRWTATHLLVMRSQDKDPEQLSKDRFRLALLFGDEKGEGENKVGLAKYLDDLNKKAAQLYREKVHEYFATTDTALPNHSGHLHFYPTFFNLISLEVINPHDRATRAGKQPIYFESVPAKAEGVFSLLYLPFDRIAEAEARADLSLVAEAIYEMMCTYGFAAKKSSGFGEAIDELSEGRIVTTAKEPKSLTRLSTLKDEVSHVQWS